MHALLIYFIFKNEDLSFMKSHWLVLLDRLISSIGMIDEQSAVLLSIEWYQR